MQYDKCKSSTPDMRELIGAPHIVQTHGFWWLWGAATWGYVVFLCTFSVPACGQLQPSLPMAGVLLAQENLGDHVHAGIYGPATTALQDAALLTVLVLGDQTHTITSGWVLMATPENAVERGQSPPPAGWYVPFGQWSPDRESEWRQFMIVSPRSLWVLPIVPIAHASFRSSAGELLDALLLDPRHPIPKPALAFRDRDAYDQAGLCFVSDESILTTHQMIGIPQAPRQARGAHGLKFSFPVIINDPSTTIGFWVACEINKQLLTQMLTVTLVPQEKGTNQRETASEAPTVTEPEDGAAIEETVKVIGQTSPGALAVAWLELWNPDAPETRILSTPVRHMADQNGWFEIILSVPSAARSTHTNLVCELHVRHEAPGYQSPETVHRLLIQQ